MVLYLLSQYNAIYNVCFFQKRFIIKTWLFFDAFFFVEHIIIFAEKKFKQVQFKMTDTIGYRCGSQLMESLYWHSYGFWRHSLRYCGIHWTCIHLVTNVVVISKKKQYFGNCLNICRGKAEVVFRIILNVLLVVDSIELLGWFPLNTFKSCDLYFFFGIFTKKDTLEMESKDGGPIKQWERTSHHFFIYFLPFCPHSMISSLSWNINYSIISWNPQRMLYCIWKFIN